MPGGFYIKSKLNGMVLSIPGPIITAPGLGQHLVNTIQWPEHVHLFLILALGNLETWFREPIRSYIKT